MFYLIIENGIVIINLRIIARSNCVCGFIPCSVSSNIAQTFLQSVLEAFSHTETQVRLAALQVTLHTLVQGLVHPGQCVPYLIAMSTDVEPAVKLKADQQLTEYSNRFGGFLQVCTFCYEPGDNVVESIPLTQTHLTLGLKRAYQFQRLLTPVSF